MEIKKIPAFLLIAFVAFVIALLSALPANAEAGSMSVTNVSSVNFVYSVTGQNSIYNNTFRNISVDVAHYNQLDTIEMNWTYNAIRDNKVQFLTGYNQTTFTITSCGSGSGIAILSNVTYKFIWYFNKPNTITCSPIQLTYQQDIFDLNNFWLSRGTSSAYLGQALPGVDINHPVSIYFNKTVVSGAVDMVLDGTFTGGTNYFNAFNETVDTRATINYNITYPIGSTFVTSIDKTPTVVLSKVTIQNVTGTPVNYTNQGDTNFNNNNFSVENVFGNGIALNLTITGGVFNLLNVNFTTTPTPNASNPSAANCPVNCIETSKPTYNNTESVNVFGSFYPANTTVTECLFFGFICEDKTINTESTTGYVFISTQGSTSPVKFLSFLTDQHNNYNLYTGLDIGTYQAQLYGFAAPGSTCTNGIVYDAPLIPLGCYYPHNITTFSVVNASGNLSIVWQTKLSNSTAIYGDTVSVAWTNVTANDTVVIYDMNGTINTFYNINQSIVSQIPVFIPLYTIGTWNATIYNASNHNHNATAFLNVLPPGAVDVNNSFGITMYWSKGTDVINNPTQLNWNTGTYTGAYNISVLLNGVEVRRTAFNATPGQIQQAMYTFDTAGAYVAEFLDNASNVQQQATIRIATGTITTTPSVTNVPSGSDASQSLGNNLISFMAMPAFWGLIILVLALWLTSTSYPTAIPIVAFVVANIEAIIGLFNPFMWYVLVITWILAAVYFRMSRDTVTGVK